MKPSLLLIALLMGCANSYKPPPVYEVPETRSTVTYQGDKNTLMDSAILFLMEKGYSIVLIDREAGLITTAPKSKRVAMTEMNCGSSLSLRYVNDLRSHIRIAVSVRVFETKMRMVLSVDGSFACNNLVCYSTGMIEEKYLAKIMTTFYRKQNLERKVSPLSISKTAYSE